MFSVQVSNARRIVPFGVLCSLVVAGLLGLVVSAGVTSGAATPEAAGGRTLTLDDVVAALQAGGLAVEETDQTIEQPFFAVPARIVRVEGQDLQVFVYPSDEARTADSDQISPDGTQVGTAMVTWVAKPHFVAAANLLTLFVSDDEELAERIGAAVRSLDAGATASPVASPVAGVWTLADVVAALRAAGLIVESTDQTVTHDFFAVPATIIRANALDVQVFVYPGEAEREADSSTIGGNGYEIGTAMVGWMEPPHFATAGNVMTLLVSNDADLAAAIEQALAALGTRE